MLARTAKGGLLAGAALLLALPAFAQPAPGPRPHHPPGGYGGPMMLMRLLDRADQDFDGKVTEAELTSAVERQFAAMDGNKDGALTLQEVQAYAASQARRAPTGEQLERMNQHTAAMFRMADADRDGRVTPEEFRVPVLAMFRALDADGDRVVTKAELPAMRGPGGPGHRGPGPHGGPGAPPPPPPAQRG
jgi:hypothetical protein